MIQSVLSNWVALAVMGAVSVVLTPILVRGLGEFHYGMWILAASLVDYFSLLDLGVRTTLQRFVAWTKGADERDARSEVFATAFSLTIGVAGVICLLAGGLAIWFPSFFDLTGPDRVLFQWLIGLLGPSLAITLLARLLGAYLCGLQRFDLYNLAAIVSTFVRAALLLAALYVGYGVLGVTGATFAVSIVSLGFHWRLLRSVDRHVRFDWERVRWTRMREMAGFSFYIFLNTTGTYLRSYTDSIVIARILGVALVTPFNIATRMMEYFSSIIIGVIGPFMPAMSELEGGARSADLQKLYLRATKITALLSLFISTLFVLHGDVLLRVWVGDAFAAIHPIVMILTVGYAVSLGQSPSSVLLIALGRHRALALWTLAEGLANLGLSIYWARHYGLVGVALGTALPMVVVKIGIQPWYTLRTIDLSARRYLTVAFARPAVVGALFIVAAVLWTVVSPAHDLVSLLGAVAWHTTWFALLTYSVGLSGQERHALLERTRRVAVGLRLLRTGEKV